MKSKERRGQIDYCQSCRSPQGLLDRRDTECHAQHIHRHIEELKKDIGATPRSQKAMTSDDEWIDEVFGRENSKSIEDSLKERDTPNEEQQNEYAACGNGITLGNIHGNDQEMGEEGGKMKCFGERNIKDLRVHVTAIHRAEGDKFLNSVRRIEVLSNVIQNEGQKPETDS